MTSHLRSRLVKLASSLYKGDVRFINRTKVTTEVGTNQVVTSKLLGLPDPTDLSVVPVGPSNPQSETTPWTKTLT
jgi:hypothetical protein